MLRPGGALVFNSGDLDSPVRELERAAPLHCVYRRAREHLHATERYQEALQQLAASDRDAHRKVLKGHAVFPEPLDLQLVDDVLEEVGFRRERIEHRVILKSHADACDFAQVSRLTATAGAFPDLAERRTLIAAGLERAWHDLRQEEKANADAVRTFWTFGVYRKPA